MAKFCGRIGFLRTRETAPGVWTPKLEWRQYTGDIVRNYRRWDNNEYVNDDFNITNSISIVADSYAYECLGLMRCVEWMGSKWKISSVDVQRPRIIISMGGLYNDMSETCSCEEEF